MFYLVQCQFEVAVFVDENEYTSKQDVDKKMRDTIDRNKSDIIRDESADSMITSYEVIDEKPRDEIRNSWYGRCVAWGGDGDDVTILEALDIKPKTVSA